VKMGTRDIGLLSAGFILGAAVVGVLTMTTEKPGVAPTSSGGAPLSILASTSRMPRLTTLPVIRVKEPFKVEVDLRPPNRCESWTPGLGAGGSSLDLFSTGHQLQLENFRLDDAR
jgi:hypothetical protein